MLLPLLEQTDKRRPELAFPVARTTKRIVKRCWHGDGATAQLTSPHAQFYRFAGLTDDSDTFADVDIRPVDGYIPGFHEGVVWPQ